MIYHDTTFLFAGKLGFVDIVVTVTLVVFGQLFALEFAQFLQ